MAKEKRLDIYVDESGDFSSYSNDNPLYSVAFVVVNSEDDNNKQIKRFNDYLNELFGGNHFVHVGNLVRAEKPYELLKREERWKIFYVLYLFSMYAKYKLFTVSIIKTDSKEDTLLQLAKSIVREIEEHFKYLRSYKLVLHYDFGQTPLAGIISSVFVAKFSDCEIIKTFQQETPFMQLADFYSYFELLKYKINKGYLSNSERKFFGDTRTLKKKYLKTIVKKYM